MEGERFREQAKRLLKYDRQVRKGQGKVSKSSVVCQWESKLKGQSILVNNPGLFFGLKINYLFSKIHKINQCAQKTKI